MIPLITVNSLLAHVHMNVRTGAAPRMLAMALPGVSAAARPAAQAAARRPHLRLLLGPLLDPEKQVRDLKAQR